MQLCRTKLAKLTFSLRNENAAMKWRHRLPYPVYPCNLTICETMRTRAALVQQVHSVRYINYLVHEHVSLIQCFSLPFRLIQLNLLFRLTLGTTDDAPQEFKFLTAWGPSFDKLSQLYTAASSNQSTATSCSSVAEQLSAASDNNNMFAIGV